MTKGSEVGVEEPDALGDVVLCAGRDRPLRPDAVLLRVPRRDSAQGPLDALGPRSLSDRRRHVVRAGPARTRR